MGICWGHRFYIHICLACIFLTLSGNQGRTFDVHSAVALFLSFKGKGVIFSKESNQNIFSCFVDDMSQNRR